MTAKEAVNWIINIMADIGKSEHRALWHYEQALMEIREMLEASAQQWIPCSEKLPEDDVEVLVYLFERSSPYIAWVEDCRWYTEDFEVEKENYPTAWMPLPEPYKAERREEWTEI